VALAVPAADALARTELEPEPVEIADPCEDRERRSVGLFDDESRREYQPSTGWTRGRCRSCCEGSWGSEARPHR
jgi:hypothetical protein